MPWFRVDDTLAFHTKTMEAGNAAMGLWVRAGSWSMQTLSDGFIPASVALSLGTRKQCEKLVACGFWDEKDNGYSFHEWTERQPTRAQIQSEREQSKERARQWRQEKTKVRRKT